MTSASKQIITRCPKCGTAFRVTPTQLQSAKGAVRCGSCLHVFKAQEYIVANPQPAVASTVKPATTTATADITKPATQAKETRPPAAGSVPQKNTAPSSPPNKPEPTAEPTILSTIKPLNIEPAPPPIAKVAAPQPKKPVVRVIDKASLVHTDDILISDDMDDHKSEAKSYDFDGFIDISTTPVSDVSLFERKIRNKEEDVPGKHADESWAEMLIDDEDDYTPQLGVVKPKTDEQLADDALLASHAINTEHVKNDEASAPSSPATTTPGLMFSLVGEKEESRDQTQAVADSFVFSDELLKIPDNPGFNPSPIVGAPDPLLDPAMFKMPDESTDDNSLRRQVKTQPKLRAYDGSRTALLMNIIPAPIELSAKRMRRWYQRKLWPSLSLLALLALIIQVGWFKFDYFSRAEPYRTGYLFLCPYIGCQVPTLVDTSRIVASNLVVRETPEAPGALTVDVMIINNAPFEQPYPDLVLVFTNIDGKQVASRRFVPNEYLGGEVAGQDLMPQNTKVHISLDMVDPGPEAVNYHIEISR